MRCTRAWAMLGQDTEEQNSTTPGREDYMTSLDEPASGESHADVRRAVVGWILHGMRDPGRHDIRSYAAAR
jgi:hypothetical protein